MGFSLDYDCCMTQLPPGEFFYDKGGTVGRFCETVLAKAKYESGNSGVVHKGSIFLFLSFPVFFLYLI